MGPLGDVDGKRGSVGASTSSNWVRPMARYAGLAHETGGLAHESCASNGRHPLHQPIAAIKAARSWLLAFGRPTTKEFW